MIISNLAEGISNSLSSLVEDRYAHLIFVKGSCIIHQTDYEEIAMEMISKIIPILLIVVGLASLGLGLPDFGGDVGIPMTVAGIIGILSGVGFWINSRSN